jgi:hypothetical protein
MFLLNAPFSAGMMMPPVLVFFFSPIVSYFEQHNNMNIFKDKIKKIDVNKSGKVLKIAYIDFIGRLRIRIIYMPDADDAKQYIINRLNERNLFVTDKRHSKK